jgi:hypothetical protein
MKTHRVFALLLAAALFAFADADQPSNGCCTAEPASTKAALPDAAAATIYPLTTCFVSEEKLGEIWLAVDYINKEEGKLATALCASAARCASPKSRKTPPNI